MADVRLEGVSKYYGKVKAVDNIDLFVRDKEFLSLLGPSGCGKTTTLRCVAGLEEVTEGRIFIGERCVNDIAPRERNVAMVFQDYALYPHMNVFNNIAFPLKVRKLAKTEIEKRVYEAAELLEIRELLARKPKELSGGQRQRVALGRAIVREPSVFLLDEPLSNLDAKLRIYMRKELKRLQKTLGTTLIYVTHDQVEAMTMSDRIAIMNEGRIQQEGSAIEVYKKPANMFVGGFVGSPPMNFIDCSLDEKSRRACLDFGEFKFDINDEVADIIREASSANKIVFGIRPEDIQISKTAAPSFVKASIYVIEPIGSEVQVTVRIGGNLISVAADPFFRGEIGEEVFLNFCEARFHIFSKKTGEAIV
jgi:multiple sugar transport system ATP-binding protein